MSFKDDYKSKSKKEIWDQYCGFLDLTIDEFMAIQNRLMKEQLRLWQKSPLGKSLLKEEVSSVEEFRREFPLTNYQDYADILLLKRDDLLPAKAVIWIKTTWEGGKHPVKLAPYTSGMIETFRDNTMACVMLASSRRKYEFTVENDDTFLYGLAPLPFATGLLPRALAMHTDIEFLPNVEEAENMSFKERNKEGFKLGMEKGIDYFFGLASVAYYISKSFSSMSSGGSSSKGSGKKTKIPLKMVFRYLKAKKTCKEEGRELMPKDFFKLKGYMITGADSDCYKDELEQMWGIAPLELFAGTEPSLIAAEDFNRNGMYFFPDTCFYEFIKESDMYRCIEDENYNPKTYLFNELEVDGIYELVISVLKGGAFMRYRVKDVYKCVGKSELGIPRFKFVDRAPDVIDIAGFTRITKDLIDNVIALANLDIKNYSIVKEYNQNNKPLLHMYVELDSSTLIDSAYLKDILQCQLGIYFRYIDSDYESLKQILEMDPLEITILRCGTFEKYQQVYQKPVKSFNPSKYEIRDLVDIQQRVGEYMGVKYD
ncbi:MAG: GH3 auxin-responsive promoter family protein [Erysipelotrichaceae bacterium]|nr:GH3 auxin-responsive promoter family protein [Erysipelotrichaceae bacterium]MDD3809717.1 GH3 auxin-responsive promoter family protein [Erysipelotrichaceae bacterium]